MGSIVSLLSRFLKLRRSVRIVMVGLDGAGKTTILYKLKLDKLVQTIPTVGFNVETIRYKNLLFTVWDVGGQCKIKPLWRYYYNGVDAVIFVIDSTDTDLDRLNVCKEEIHHLAREHDLSKSAVLILANKQDLPHGIQETDVIKHLKLDSLTGVIRWCVKKSSAKTGEGIFEGLDWITHTLQDKTQQQHTTAVLSLESCDMKPNKTTTTSESNKFLENKTCTINNIEKINSLSSTFSRHAVPAVQVLSQN